MSEPDKGGPVGFPTKDIVLGSFSLPLGHFGTYLRAAWLSVALFIAASLLVAAALPPPPVPPGGDDPAALAEYMMASGGFLMVFVFEILTLLLLIPAITVWIRLTAFGPPEDGRFPLLSLGESEIRYLITYVLVLILSGVAMVAVLIAASLAGALIVAVIGALAGGIGPMMIQLSSVVGTVLGFATFIYVSARFVPALGATAMNEEIDVKSAWNETKAQARPLFWSQVSIFGILLLAQFLFLYAVGSLLPLGGSLIGGLITALIQALAILIAAVYVGRVYAYFRT